jgi:DNA recombination protein RmuC
LEALRGQMGQSMDSLTRRMVEMERSLNSRVLSMQQQVTAGMDRSTEQLSNVQQGLVRTYEMVKQVEQAGKEMQELHDILRPPKLRGQLGELLLGNLLRQVLPEGSFIEQHEFASNRVRVDAVIKLSGGLVPIDAKFPLESFQRLLAADADGDRRRCRTAFCRDVRSHIDAIASKYIAADEGTFDFALMYIPAENVYYEIITGDDVADGASLYQYALGRKVVPVSPNSFYAYLQAVALGLKGLRIERNAQLIQGRLSQLEAELKRFGDDFQTAGRHLANAHAKYDEADRRLARFGDHLQSLAISPAEETVLPGQLSP